MFVLSLHLADGNALMIIHASSGWFARGHDQEAADHSPSGARPPGYTSRYAHTGVAEDKAETFADMVMHPDFIRRKVADDGVVRRKVAYVRSMLEQFHPGFDAGFWKRAGDRAIVRSGPDPGRFDDEHWGSMIDRAIAERAILGMPPVPEAPACSPAKEGVAEIVGGMGR